MSALYRRKGGSVTLQFRSYSWNPTSSPLHSPTPATPRCSTGRRSRRPLPGREVPTVWHGERLHTWSCNEARCT